MFKDKFKLISVIEGFIIIALIVALVVNGNSNKKELEDTRDKPNVSDATQKQKSYTGIYHIYNYNKTYNEVNITINNDNTCQISIYKDDIYNCEYEETGEDKLNLIISSYIAVEIPKNEGDLTNNDFTMGWKLSNNKQGCEDKLNEMQSKSDAYNNYKGCQKATLTKEVILLNSGLLYENRQFNKIK